jgi:hypothetical protein
VLNGKSEALPAAGSIGIMHYAPGPTNPQNQLLKGEQFSLFFSVAATADTVSGSSVRDFSGSLLPATVNGHRPSVQLDYYTYHNYSHSDQGNLDQQWGFRLYGGMARTTWSADSLGTKFSSDVVIADGGARLVWTPIRQRLTGEGGAADTKVDVPSETAAGFVAVTIEGGLTGRYLFFDDVNGERMRAFALAGEKRFLGGELGIALQIKDLIASMYLPMFWKSDEHQDIPGLTGAHPQFQFTVQTRFLKLSGD